MSIDHKKQFRYYSSDHSFIKYSRFDILDKNIDLSELIKKYLLETGNTGKTRQQISESLSYPRTTIYDTLVKLKRLGVIEFDHRYSKSKRGRPKTVFYLKGKKQGRKR